MRFRAAALLLAGTITPFIASRAPAGELRELVVHAVRSDATTRFVSHDEWKFLSSLTDCPDQDASGPGPAKHPVVRVKYKEVEAAVAGETRLIGFSLPPDATYRNPVREWIVRKVVCGTKGYAVLYSDAFASGRSFVLSRFDKKWDLVGADIFLLPEVKFSGFAGGTAGKMVWRFEERSAGFVLIVLDMAKNNDRTINRAEYVALAQHEFFIAKRLDTLAGFADRPGPLMTADYLNSLPFQIMPGVNMPRDIERHDVELGNWSATTRVHVDISAKPVYLRLRALHPGDWVVTLASGTRLPAVHLWGPPPQSITGLPKETVVLRFAQQGGTREHETALALLGAHTGNARSAQKVPAHRKDEIVFVDGRLGRKVPERTNIYHPEMAPAVAREMQARIANCAVLRSQDDRIDCYKLRSEVLRGGRR